MNVTVTVTVSGVHAVGLVTTVVDVVNTVLVIVSCVVMVLVVGT